MGKPNDDKTNTPEMKHQKEVYIAAKVKKDTVVKPSEDESKDPESKPGEVVGTKVDTGSCVEEGSSSLKSTDERKLEAPFVKQVQVPDTEADTKAATEEEVLVKKHIEDKSKAQDTKQ